MCQSREKMFRPLCVLRIISLYFSFYCESQRNLCKQGLDFLSFTLLFVFLRNESWLEWCVLEELWLHVEKWHKICCCWISWLDPHVKVFDDSSNRVWKIIRPPGRGKYVIQNDNYFAIDLAYYSYEGNFDSETRLQFT